MRPLDPEIRRVGDMGKGTVKTSLDLARFGGGKGPWISASTGVMAKPVTV